MATKVITTTEYTDDIDGGSATGTVSFSFDGTSYEIDLSKKNRAAMEKVLRPYIDAARKVRGSRGRKSVATASSKRSDLADIRTWAKAQGLEVSERGRIAASVTEAYDAAH